VFPTPTIGMVGVMSDIRHHMSLDFKEKGELIFLLGEVHPCIASSEYLVRMHGVKRSPAPHFDLEAEKKLHACVREAIRRFTVQAAHDVSEGGLFVTVLEMGMPRGLGFDIETDGHVRLDAFLFGEGQGRVVVTCTEAQQDMFLDVVEAHGVPVVLLGPDNRLRFLNHAAEQFLGVSAAAPVMAAGPAVAAAAPPIGLSAVGAGAGSVAFARSAPRLFGRPTAAASAVTTAVAAAAAAVIPIRPSKVCRPTPPQSPPPYLLPHDAPFAPARVVFKPPPPPSPHLQHDGAPPQRRIPKIPIRPVSRPPSVCVRVFVRVCMCVCVCVFACV
jgi:hypothetical protein